MSKHTFDLNTLPPDRLEAYVRTAARIIMRVQQEQKESDKGCSAKSSHMRDIDTIVMTNPTDMQAVQDASSD